MPMTCDPPGSPSRITTLVLIRHGETVYNRNKTIQGQRDVPLNNMGIRQAARVAERLRTHPTFDALLSSDLLRARQTAEPVGQALGLPIVVERALRERACGGFEGLGPDQINVAFPGDAPRWRSGDPDYAPPFGGESQRAFFDRVVGAFRAIVATYRFRRVAVVTHGGVLDCVYRWINHLTLEQRRVVPLLNASLGVAVFDEHGCGTIASWADVRHLDGVGALDSGVGDLR